MRDSSECFHPGGRLNDGGCGKWMKILDRYIGKQVFVTAFYAVSVIIIILVLGNVFKDILKELAKRPDLSLSFVLKFIFLVIPVSLSLAIPFSFLTAILLTFGRLSADSEFVSMRMAGLSMGRISLPVWILALFFTGICAWVNLSITPWAKTEMEGMKDTLINIAKREPLLLFPDKQVMTELTDHLVYANKEDGVLKNFQMVKMKDNSPEILAIAEQANVSVDLEAAKPEMLIQMKNVDIMIKSQNSGFIEESQSVFMEEAESGLSLEKFKSDEERLQPENLGLFPLIETLKDPSLEEAMQATLKTELSMRMAFSLSCITFGLIAVPLGVTAQRRETTAGFVLSMVIAVSYYGMLLVAQMMRNDPSKYPHILVWIPNVLFITLGVIMFRRLNRK